MEDVDVEFCESGTMFDGGGDMVMEEFLEELLRSTNSCTHTHMCNPSGPEEGGEHTHTCFHAHMRLLEDRSGSMADGEKSVTADHSHGTWSDSMSKKQAFGGNKEGETPVISDQRHGHGASDDVICKKLAFFGRKEEVKLAMADHSHGTWSDFGGNKEGETLVISDQRHGHGESDDVMCKKLDFFGRKEEVKLAMAEHSHDSAASSEIMCKKQGFGGNKEAVRKYRQKKKAQVTLLEEQVLHLRAVNEQLARKLQAHESLQAEVARLRQILAEFRGRIDSELLLLVTQNRMGADVSSQGYGSLQRKQCLSQGAADHGDAYPDETCILPCDMNNIHCFYHCDTHGPPTPQGHSSFVVDESFVSCDLVDAGSSFHVQKQDKEKRINQALQHTNEAQD